MTFSGISGNKLPFVWDKIVELLKTALNAGPKDEELEDIKKAIAERDMQLWIAVDGNRVLAVLVTQVITRPKRSILQVLYCAGSDLDLWRKECEDTLVSYAKSLGCKAIDICGRKGWGRIFTDLTPTTWVYRRAI